jgi:LacI family transcriptional regulator
MVVWHLDAKNFKPLIEQNIPAVIWRGRPRIEGNPNLDTIYVDNVSMAKACVSYLIGKGHTRIGMIAGLEDTPPRQNRIDGFCEALSEHHLPLDDVLIQGGDFTESGGYLGMKKLLALRNWPTAVFAANDLMALGAMTAIREANLRIPDDIALIGIDDIPAAKLVHPSLTTVSQMQENIGRRAAEMLFERINGTAPTTPRKVEMPFKLIVRESA